MYSWHPGLSCPPPHAAPCQTGLTPHRSLPLPARQRQLLFSTPGRIGAVTNSGVWFHFDNIRNMEVLSRKWSTCPLLWILKELSNFIVRLIRHLRSRDNIAPIRNDEGLPATLAPFQHAYASGRICWDLVVGTHPHLADPLRLVRPLHRRHRQQGLSLPSAHLRPDPMAHR
jgi:hypothetical protein